MWFSCTKDRTALDFRNLRGRVYGCTVMRVNLHAKVR
jgi:hypothetical protein